MGTPQSGLDGCCGQPIRGVLEERGATTQQVAELLGPLIAGVSTGQALQAGTIAARQYHTPAPAA